MTIERRCVAIIGSCTTFLFTFTFTGASPSAGTAEAEAGLGNQPAGCSAFPLAGTYSQDPQTGVVVDTSPTAATVYVYRDPAGGGVAFRRPPSGWNPITATDAELTYYGLPPRPSDSDALAAWKAEWNDYTGFAGTGVCRSSESAYTGSSFTNWAGSVADSRTTYSAVEGNVFVAHDYTGGCGASDDHVDWVGLGGTNSHGLLQNGIADDTSIANSWNWWYQGITDPSSGLNYSTGILYIDGSNHYGDEVHLSTSYSGNTVTFLWHDLTTGKVQSLPTNSVGPYGASEYYSGTSAEGITERPKINGSWSPLRMWDSGDIQWSSVKVSWPNNSNVQIRNTYHTNYDMYNPSTGHYIATWQSNSGLGAYQIHHTANCT